MAHGDARYIFRIPSPSKFTDAEDKIERLTKDINKVLDELGTAFHRLSGTTGVPIPFTAHIDMHRNRITMLGDPRELLDATHKKYVDEEVEELRATIEDIQRTIHTELPVGGRFNVTLTRQMPTVVDDTIALGTFTLTHDTHAFDIAISVAASGFSVAKAYTIVTQRSINADWEIALPLVDTGEFSSQDFDLDVKQDNAASTLALRIRRTAGSTAALATIQIGMRGQGNDLFQESTATASVSAPTTYLQSARLMVREGDLLFNTKETREITASDTSFTIGGVAGVDERPGLALVNTSPGTDSFIGEIRFYADTVVNATISGHTDGATDAGLLNFFTKETGVAVALALRLTSLKNLILGGGVVSGASGEKVLVLGTGVAPTTSPADSTQLYSADIVPGNAAVHTRTENGSIVKLYTEAALTAATGGALSTGGAAVLSTADATKLTNAITRIGELEARLQALGFLP